MGDLVMEPGTMKSPVWAFFGFVVGANGKPANSEKSACKECGRTMAMKGSNMSNLLSHLWNSHPTINSWIKGNTGSAATAKHSQLSEVADSSRHWQGPSQKLPHMPRTARSGRSLKSRQIPTGSPTRFYREPS